MATSYEDIPVRPCRMHPVHETRDLEDAAILHGLSLEYFNTWRKRWDFLDLTTFLLLTFVYYLLLWTQLDIKNSFQVISSLKSVLPKDPTNGQLLSTFSNFDEIYNWINSSVVESVWSEPVCGNGLCEPPAEISAGIFTGRGCAADCGNVSKIEIYIYLLRPINDSCSRKSSLRDCPWTNLTLRWTALNESERNIQTNAIRLPSGRSGSIDGTLFDFYLPEEYSEDDPSPYVGLYFELDQGPYVKWYMDIPLIESNVEIESYFNLKTTVPFVTSLGFQKPYLNRLRVYKEKNETQTYIMYDPNFEVLKDKEDVSCVDSEEAPYNISGAFDFSPKTIRCNGTQESHVRVNIINPVSMYADYLSSPPRTLDSTQKFSNRILIGALLTLTRRNPPKKDCSVTNLTFNYTTSVYQPEFNKDYGRISKWCQPSDEDNARQFGSSPLFNRDSSFYNISGVKSFYSNSDFFSDKWYETPYAFNDSISEGKNGSPTFFVLLDVIIEKDMASKIVAYLKDGGFIDSLSDVLTLRILSFNSDFELFSLLKVEISFSEEGSINIENKIESLPTKSRKIYEVFFVLYWILLSALILIELVELVYHVCHLTVLQFLWWNLLDIITYSLLFANGILWLIISQRLKRFRPLPHYNVFTDDLFHNMDVMLLSNDTAEYNGTPGYIKMFEQYDYFEDTLHLKNVFISITCINSIFLVFRLIKLCDFDANFGIISRTISSIGFSMMNLTILWVVLSMGYATAGILAFGDKMENFKDVNHAFNTLGQIVLGDSTINAMFDIVYPDYSQSLPAHIYFWSYVFIAYVILINFVIAVSCYSFQNLYELTLKKERLKNVKSSNETLFLLMNPKFTKSHYYLFHILKHHFSKSSLSKLFKEVPPLNETQRKSGSLEAYGSSNHVPDPICSMKLLYIYGTRVTHERIFSVMKSKLAQYLKVPDNRLDKETYDLVHLIFCCYGVDKPKLDAKNIKEKKLESENELLCQFTAFKKELREEIRSILSSSPMEETLDRPREHKESIDEWQSQFKKELLSEIRSIITSVPERGTMTEYMGDRHPVTINFPTV